MAQEVQFHPITFVDVLRFRAEHHADQRAFVYLPDGETEGGSLTYGELDLRARSIAAWLQSWCPKGERALLAYSHALEFIAAFFGCLYAGVAAVPVQPPNRNRPSPRIGSIARNAQASVVLTTTNLVSKLEQHAHIPELMDLRRQTTDDLDRELEAGWRNPEMKPGELAFLQYTSGSTTTPKGVMVSHGNLMHNSGFIQFLVNNSPDCVNGTWLPPFHDMGLIEGVLQPVYCGYPSVIMPPMAFLQRPVRWLRMITKYKVTNSGGPNSAFDLCVQRIKPDQRETLDLRSWSFCYNGSEPVRKQTLEQFYEMFGRCGLGWQSIHPVYGLAEATLAVSCGRRVTRPLFFSVSASCLAKNEVVPANAHEPGERTLVASGPIHPAFLEVAIVDPESHRRCAPDRIGEIWLKGASVSQGYWNLPQETANTFHAYESKTAEGPFLRTGDLGFLKDEELFITGRIKDIIILAGRNHYPQDIELTAEQAHPALRTGCGAAFSIEENGEERLILVYEIDREYFHKGTLDEMIGSIRQAIAEEHGIRVWEVFFIRPGSISKTSSGKIQRQNCKIRFLAGEFARLGIEKMMEQNKS